MADTINNGNSLPQTVKVKDIDRRSAEWERYHHAWDLLHWMYVGGVEIEQQAEQFLKKRPKEPSDVYQVRIEHFNYENHLGTAMDWYLAALLEKPPRVEPAVPTDGASQGADAAPVDPNDMLDDGQIEFYDDFSKNCDRAGTPIGEVLRGFLQHLLLFNRAAILIDLPRKGDFQTLAEQQAAGALDPYLVNLEPRSIINQSTDAHGNLDWIMYHSRESETAGPFSKLQLFDRWYYFDRQNFAIYERELPVDQNTGLPEAQQPEGAEATLKDSGPHALSEQNVVPVIWKQLPRGLWLANRAYLVTKKHLNTGNSLDWALFMSAMAMPVIKMDGEFHLTLTEAATILLPRDSEYSWSEPEGKSFGHLADRSDSLKEEIFRAFYLIAQSRSTKATASAQSGVSKQEDMTAPKKILNLFGDLMRTVWQQVMDMVSDARGDDVEWDVQGMNFPEDPPNDTLDLIATAQAIGVPSDTFEKEMEKMAVDAALPNANTLLKQKIYKEIDTAPNKADRELQSMQQQAATLVTSKMGKTDFKGVG